MDFFFVKPVGKYLVHDTSFYPIGRIVVIVYRYLIIQRILIVLNTLALISIRPVAVVYGMIRGGYFKMIEH